MERLVSFSWPILPLYVSNECFLNAYYNFLAVTDEVERRVVHTFNGHTSRIRSMAVDEQKNVLITGSVEGNMKVRQLYDLSSAKHTTNIVTDLGYSNI